MDYITKVLNETDYNYETLNNDSNAIIENIIIPFVSKLKKELTDTYSYINFDDKEQVKKIKNEIKTLVSTKTKLKIQTESKIIFSLSNNSKKAYISENIISALEIKKIFKNRYILGLTSAITGYWVNSIAGTPKTVDFGNKYYKKINTLTTTLNDKQKQINITSNQTNINNEFVKPDGILGKIYTRLQNEIDKNYLFAKDIISKYKGNKNKYDKLDKIYGGINKNDSYANYNEYTEYLTLKHEKNKAETIINEIQHNMTQLAENVEKLKTKIEKGDMISFDEFYDVLKKNMNFANANATDIYNNANANFNKAIAEYQNNIINVIITNNEAKMLKNYSSVFNNTTAITNEQTIDFVATLNDKKSPLFSLFDKYRNGGDLQGSMKVEYSWYSWIADFDYFGWFGADKPTLTPQFGILHELNSEDFKTKLSAYIKSNDNIKIDTEVLINISNRMLTNKTFSIYNDASELTYNNYTYSEMLPNDTLWGIGSRISNQLSNVFSTLLDNIEYTLLGGVIVVLSGLSYYSFKRPVIKIHKIQKKAKQTIDHINLIKNEVDEKKMFMVFPFSEMLNEYYAKFRVCITKQCLNTKDYVENRIFWDRLLFDRPDDKSFFKLNKGFDVCMKEYENPIFLKTLILKEKSICYLDYLTQLLILIVNMKMIIDFSKTIQYVSVDERPKYVNDTFNKKNGLEYINKIKTPNVDIDKFVVNFNTGSKFDIYLSDVFNNVTDIMKAIMLDNEYSIYKTSLNNTFFDVKGRFIKEANAELTTIGNNQQQIKRMNGIQQNIKKQFVKKQLGNNKKQIRETNQFLNPIYDVDYYDKCKKATKHKKRIKTTRNYVHML